MLIAAANHNINIAQIELLSQRGNPVLIYGARTYYKDSARCNFNRTKLTEYFRCRTSLCKGRLRKVFNIDANGQVVGLPEIFSAELSHIISCIGDANSILVDQARQFIVRESTLNGGGSISLRNANGIGSGLLRNVIGDVAAAQLPNTLRMQRSVNRHIHSINGQPPNRMIDVLEIPLQLGVTLRGEQFLSVFSRFVPSDGSIGGMIIVFATKADLLKLFAERVISVDGIDGIKPIPYHRRRASQVFTLIRLEC